MLGWSECKKRCRQVWNIGRTRPRLLVFRSRPPSDIVSIAEMASQSDVTIQEDIVRIEISTRLECELSQTSSVSSNDSKLDGVISTNDDSIYSDDTNSSSSEEDVFSCNSAAAVMGDRAGEKDHRARKRSD